MKFSKIAGLIHSPWGSNSVNETMTISADDLLRSINICPVCRGTSFCPSIPALMNQQHSHYERSWASHFGLTAEELFKGVSEILCTRCGCVFNSPYFEPYVEDKLYRDVTPRHRAGWQNWNALMSGSKPTSRSRHKIADYLINRFPKVARYAEIGCPFQGILPLLSTESDRRAAIRRSATRGNTPGVALLSHLERFVHRVRYRDRSGDILSTSPNIDAKSFWAPERFMISEPSGNRWQSGCIQSGASCLGVVGSLANVHSLSLDSLPSLVESRGLLDLISVFESLDHVRFPIELLHILCKSTQRLLIVQHQASKANRQHGFGFTGKFLDYLVGEVQPQQVTDLSSHFGNQVSFVWLLEFNNKI